MNQITQLTGQAPPAPASTAPRSTALGQQDFLTLLTAQLKNQNPLKPMENAEFLSQMAQFSTVAGIDRINDTLGGFGGSLRDMRISMATTLLGQSVLVPGSVAYPDKEGAIRGAVDLPRPVEALSVTYTDARNGAILHSETLGAQAPGLVGFDWTDVPASLVAQRSPVRVSISAIEDGQNVPLDPQVYARVLSASAGGEDVTLQVEGFGALNSLEIAAFR